MSWNRERMTGLFLEARAMGLGLKRHLKRELKADSSVVTQADRQIEALLTEELEDTDNGVYIIGEETVDQKGEDYLDKALAGKAYVIDPIDGTSPYAHGMPNWGVSIGYMENGRLIDGGVYLPEFGEIVLSDGDAVVEGVLGLGDEDDAWEWSELEPSTDSSHSMLVAVTQALAKWGHVDIPNPVQVLGAAVVPMLGLVQGRFLAYLGSVKLWDIAGALPLVLRHGFVASVRVGTEIRRVTDGVDDAVYQLSADSKRRWKLRSELLVCRPEDEVRLRASFRRDAEN